MSKNVSFWFFFRRFRRAPGRSTGPIHDVLPRVIHVGALRELPFERKNGSGTSFYYILV